MTVVENEKAITSWSGFIYQGMIAVLTSLHKLSNDYNTYKSCVLKIEKLDDFSIHDANDVCLSLHQVKCKKAILTSAYVDAIESLTIKRRQLNNVPSFLHTSVGITDFTSTTVSLYDYDGSKYMPILQVLEKQEKYLEKILTEHFDETYLNKEVVRVLVQKLNFVVIDIVLKAHSENMVGNRPLGEVNRSINMSTFMQVIKDYDLSGSPIDYVQVYKQHFSLLCREYIQEEGITGDELSHIDVVFDRINNLSEDNFEKFLQILLPMTELEKIGRNNFLTAIPTGFDVPFLYFMSKTFGEGYFCTSKCRYEIEHDSKKLTPFALADSSSRNKVTFAEKLFRTMLENKKTAEFYYTGDIIISRDTDIENLFDFMTQTKGGINPYPSGGDDFNDPKKIKVLNYKAALKLLGLEE